MGLETGDCVNGLRARLAALVDRTNLLVIGTGSDGGFGGVCHQPSSLLFLDVYLCVCHATRDGQAKNSALSFGVLRKAKL